MKVQEPRHIVLSVIQSKSTGKWAVWGHVASKSALPEHLTGFALKVGVAVAIGKTLGASDTECALLSACTKTQEGHWEDRNCSWSLACIECDEVGREPPLVNLSKNLLEILGKTEHSLSTQSTSKNLEFTKGLNEALKDTLGVRVEEWSDLLSEHWVNLWNQGWNGFELFFSLAEKATLNNSLLDIGESKTTDAGSALAHSVAKSRRL